MYYSCQKFSLNLIMRKQSNPDCRTFYKKAGLVVGGLGGGGPRGRHRLDWRVWETNAVCCVLWLNPGGDFLVSLNYKDLNWDNWRNLNMNFKNDVSNFLDPYTVVIQKCILRLYMLKYLGLHVMMSVGQRDQTNGQNVDMWVTTGILSTSL